MLDRRSMFSAIILLAVVAGLGCEMLHNAGLPGMEPFLKVNAAQAEEERSLRDQFVLHRDHKGFYWLLANRVENGMPLKDVEQALGEPGELETGMGQLKSDGLYQTTDLAYKWGPDRTGYSAIVFFRDGHVVNFNPKLFKNP